jgi:farnesyl-diphosphate farnesyltransferase
MAGELETDVLKAVSRSFYLSLRFLPAPMRRPAGIAYLLARTSDTIADSAAVSPQERIAFLEDFSQQVRGEAGKLPEKLAEGVDNDGEKALLRRSGEVVAALATLSGEEQALVREVLETIIGGQKLDLERFGEADGNHVVCLPDEAALDDYTWRVAGCVGSFWTKLGFQTLGKDFSEFPQEELIEWGIEYGKGLQLVNILRDLPADLKAGRCYLPVEGADHRAVLMTEFSKWRERAVEKVAKGRKYSKKLAKKRLRVASVLPAMIAEETLRMMEEVSFSRLEERIKVPRPKVYGMILNAWFSR